MSDETNKEANFDAAFDELAKLGDASPAPKEPEPAAAPEPAAVAETTVEETQAQTQEPENAGSGEQAEPQAASEGTPTEGESQDPVDEGVAEGEADGAEEQDEDLLNRLSALLAKTKPAEPAPPPPAPKQEQPPEPELLSAEEIQLIEEAEKDWPDVVRAVRAERNAAVRQAVDHVFTEIARELRPLMQTVQVLAQRTHLQELQSKVPDYDTVTEKVISWVDKQPAYLQSAYKQVIQQGTAEEVADLIARFKADAGSKAATSAAPAPAPAKKKAELPTATKQAAAALAPVSTKRTAPASGGIDPSDFDGAFAAFADRS